jgi:hypothetical protein
MARDRELVRLPLDRARGGLALVQQRKASVNRDASRNSSLDIRVR